MINLPEDETPEPPAQPGNNTEPQAATQAAEWIEAPPDEPSRPDAAATTEPEPPTTGDLQSAVPEQLLFQSYLQPPAKPPARIPHFGHLLLLMLLIGVAFGILVLFLGLASYFHLFGWQLTTKSATNLDLNLAGEAFLYLVTLGFCLLVFPLIWEERYFTGLQWRADVVRSRLAYLVSMALGCFALAIIDQFLMPGPSNAPIEKMISSPRAAWLMFAFGITMAPFFEEMFFRGFLLPALATAWDWIEEEARHRQPRPLDANGHPQWSMPAMIAASIATSIPFALLHFEQQGRSLGPFLLLIAISLALCGVRLKSRSLAASTLVHACYNFLIFSVELVVTGGFRHFDKM